MPDSLKRPDGEEYVKQAIWSSKYNRISSVWIVPIIALLIAGVLIYQSQSEKGPIIHIFFKSAEGIQANKSLIKYKDIAVGKVIDIRFAKDLKSVEITAELKKEMKYYLSKNTRFWIVHAHLSADSIEGLDTLISGAYIEMEPQAGSEELHHFRGLENPPVIQGKINGRVFVLEADDKGSLQNGSPIYYKKLKAGKVISTHLSENKKRVLIDVFIQKPFSQLITDTTHFWNASGIDATIGPEGVEIRTASLTSILSGGISFDNFQRFGRGHPIKDKHHFILFKNIKEAKKIQYQNELYFWVYFKESIRGLQVGSPVDFRGVKVGEVVNFFLIGDTKSAEFSIPVLIKIEPERFAIKNIDKKRPLINETIFKKFIKKGLRAQLQSSNLLTGTLFINLDFFPDTPTIEPYKDNGLYVFPSVPGMVTLFKNNLKILLKKFSSLPLEDMSKNINLLLEKVDNNTLPQISESVNQINTQLLPSFTHLIKSGDSTLEQIRKNYINTNADIHRQMIQLLNEIKATSQSIRQLTNYLNRHPESLIRGR